MRELHDQSKRQWGGAELNEWVNSRCEPIQQSDGVGRQRPHGRSARLDDVEGDQQSLEAAGLHLAVSGLRQRGETAARLTKREQIVDVGRRPTRLGVVRLSRAFAKNAVDDPRRTRSLGLPRLPSLSPVSISSSLDPIGSSRLTESPPDRCLLAPFHPSIRGGTHATKDIDGSPEIGRPTRHF